jgi:hypothetical protein
MGCPRIDSRWWRDFPYMSTPAQGPLSLLYKGYRVSFAGVKRPGRGVDHPPPSGAEVKERLEIYLSSPSEPSWTVVVWILRFMFKHFWYVLYDVLKVQKYIRIFQAEIECCDRQKRRFHKSFCFRSTSISDSYFKSAYTEIHRIFETMQIEAFEILEIRCISEFLATRTKKNIPKSNILWYPCTRPPSPYKIPITRSKTLHWKSPPHSNISV